MLNRKRRYGSLILAFLLILGCIATAVYGATEDELQDQLDAAEAARDAAQYQIDMTVNTIEGIQSEIEKADEAMSIIEGQIRSLDQSLTELNDLIGKTQAELKEAEKKRDQQKKDMEKRMRVMYQFDGDGYFGVLFTSKSFGDLIQRLDVMISVMTADRAGLKALDDANAKIKAKDADLQKQKSELDAKKKEQEDLKAKQQDILVQQKALLAQNEGIKAEYEAQVAEQEAIMEQAREELSALAAQRQREIQGEGGYSGRTSSSGYIWPSDYDYITSYFGYRDAPTSGASSYHEGVDIGASYGSPIYASASGEVILAGWYGGYGYCVEIAHPSGYTTLYGHQSEVACYVGEWVEQGEVIGYCGSTGVSTGPHIHFSIIDPWGDFVDPLDFV